MNQATKRNITSISIHIVFVLCTFLINVSFPSDVKYAPAWGILVIFAWGIYTILATLRSLVLFVEEKKGRLIPLLINFGLLIFLIVVFTSIGFERFAEHFTI